PGCDHATAPPELGDIAQIEVVLIVLGVAERRRFGVDLVQMLADVGIFEDSHTFGVRGHDAVLDSVVHHFYEMAGAVLTTVEIALFGGATEFFAAGSARYIAWAGRKRFED